MKRAALPGTVIAALLAVTGCGGSGGPASYLATGASPADFIQPGTLSQADVSIDNNAVAALHSKLRRVNLLAAQAQARAQQQQNAQAEQTAQNDLGTPRQAASFGSHLGPLSPNVQQAGTSSALLKHI